MQLKPKPFLKSHKKSNIEEHPDLSNSVDDSKSINVPEKQNDSSSNETNKQYPKGLKLVLIFVSLCSSTFLVALDSTIIATAIPTITSQFNSLDDISWYNAAFLLTLCAFQLPYGRAYTLLNTKWTFLSSIAIFLVGCIVCGTAPNSIALIIGRAIAGTGGSGIFSGCFIIITEVITLRKRSLFAGFIGATFGIASVIGPLIGKSFYNPTLD
jgi:MFS family permease